MNPHRAAALGGMLLARSTWYRAVPGRYSPLAFHHTSKATTRFGSAGSHYFTLYFAADPQTALLEVEAVVAAHNPRPTHGIRPSAYTVWPISVALNNVIDFGDPRCRRTVETSAQELTGDWRARRPLAGSPPVVRSRAHDAPTQQLGAALEGDPDVEGFLTPSARAPTVSNLVVFPHRVRIDPTRLRIASRVGA